SDGFEVHAPVPATAVAGVAHVSDESRQGSDRVGFLHSAHRDLSGPVRARDTDPQLAPSGAFNVTEHPTAEWTARQLIEACGQEERARHLVRDRDQVYGERFSRQARRFDIRRAGIAPRSPGENAYAELVIGSIRRECLDHVVVIGERHLLRILSTYVACYNGTRTHLSLAKDAPEPRSVQPPIQGRVVEVPRVGG